MSAQNVQLARSAYEAFARDDLDAVLAVMDSAIEWHEAGGLPNGGVYRGLDAVRSAVFDPLDGSWDGFRADPEEFLDAGDDLVVLGRYTGRSLGSGRELDVPFAHVSRFRGGKAVLFRQFTDTAEWLAALGG